MIKKYLVFIFIHSFLLGKKIEVKSQHIRCSDLFPESLNLVSLFTFSGSGQEIRVFGTSLRDWASQCGMPNPIENEIFISTKAKFFNEEDISKKLTEKFHRDAIYRGNGIWSYYNLEDLEVSSLPKGISLRTALESQVSGNLKVSAPHYVTRKELEAGDLIEEEVLEKKLYLPYEVFLKKKLIEMPQGLTTIAKLPVGTILDENTINRVVVNAGTKLKVVLQTGNMHLESSGKLTTRSKVGDYVKIKTLKQKIIQGKLVRPDLVIVEI